MLTRDRSKRKYGFGDHTAPTKLECLEFVEKEKEMDSARLAELIKFYLPPIFIGTTRNKETRC